MMCLAKERATLVLDKGWRGLKSSHPSRRSRMFVGVTTSGKARYDVAHMLTRSIQAGTAQTSSASPSKVSVEAFASVSQEHTNTAYSRTLARFR